MSFNETVPGEIQFLTLMNLQFIGWSLTLEDHRSHIDLCLHPRGGIEVDLVRFKVWCTCDHFRVTLFLHLVPTVTKYSWFIILLQKVAIQETPASTSWQLVRFLKSCSPGLAGDTKISNYNQCGEENGELSKCNYDVSSCLKYLNGFLRYVGNKILTWLWSPAWFGPCPFFLLIHATLLPTHRVIHSSTHFWCNVCFQFYEVIIPFLPGAGKKCLPSHLICFSHSTLLLINSYSFFIFPLKYVLPLRWHPWLPKPQLPYPHYSPFEYPVLPLIVLY